MQLMRKPFIFMRHGETDANQNHLFCGATDIALNAMGRQQAINARNNLAAIKTDHMTVISSPMKRAIETTRLALPDASFVTEPGLTERDWGALEMTALTKPVCYQETPSGGEPWQDFIERVTTALNTILHNYEHPLIIAHSGVYRAIQFHLTGSPAGPRIPNATPVRFWPDQAETYGWQQSMNTE
ncbi:histidine phosphatase family protein [Photobacterium sp. MCCC 1A19761]|uniref:histidine phosphatase family protein n=1 Tax=Photobacterium sp. MCCC 1A19761 TaxID=3115000 RepID=UPI00307EA4D6